MIITEEFKDVIESLPRFYKENKLDIFLGKKKIALIMRYGLDGNKPMTFREVGAELGWKPDSTRKVIIQSLKRLKRIYRNEFNSSC